MFCEQTGFSVKIGGRLICLSVESLEVHILISKRRGGYK